VPDATFARPDLTAFARLDELGLEVVGRRLEPARAVLACRVREPDQWCRRCGREGVPRDTVVRRLADEPLGWRPTTLEFTVRRYRCTGCGHVWRQDTTRAAQPRAKISRRGLWWALEGLVCQHLTVARVAEGLGVSWNTANDAVLAEGHAGPDRGSRPVRRGHCDRGRSAHHQAEGPVDSPVHRRRARPGRGHLGHLPAHDHRLPRTRPHPRPDADDEAHRVGQRRRSSRADRARHPSGGP